MNGKIIKLTHPIGWTRAVKGLKTNYKQQTPLQDGNWKENKFIINQHIDYCDLWIVHGDLDDKSTVHCKGPTVFILSEEADQKIWNEDFLKQFDIVLGSQENISHSNYIRGQYLCPWQIDKSYNDLFEINDLHKDRVLSAIISDSTFNDGHKKRFAFVNQLKGHFKERLDWFGRGNIFLENKWDGLANYKYSIAIENSSHQHYWTEKIADCFLALTIPIYYGCTNLNDYFPEGSFIQIDVNDLEKSIKVIEDAIQNDWYNKNKQALVEAKRLIMEEYQFFPCVLSQLKDIVLHINYQKRTLYPEKHFLPKRKITHLITRAIQLIKEA